MTYVLMRTEEDQILKISNFRLIDNYQENASVSLLVFIIIISLIIYYYLIII